MRIAFLGSSLVSAKWNGAATYYRGILRALHGRGVECTFFEPDAFDRQRYRDIPDPSWCRVRVWPATVRGMENALEEALLADLVIKASRVGVFDEDLERAVVGLRQPGRLVAFWDVDAPATLARANTEEGETFRARVPAYDLVLTYGGGHPVVAAYEALGARRCVPIYNALDPSTHHPEPPRARFQVDLAFLANRLPDREARASVFFFEVAGRLPHRTFLLGGSGWNPEEMPGNVRFVGNVRTGDHNAFNASPRMVLNVCRDSMATNGYSPATRVFEAAGAGACVITDAWKGVEQFLTPGEEVLVAHGTEEVCRLVETVSPDRAAQIGAAARQRVLAEHTYEHRADELCRVLHAARRADRHGPTVKVRAPRPLNVVFLGLSITSAWGNGHATTYRGLVRELWRRGHVVLFLERDRPWYAAARDLPRPPFGTCRLYRSWAELASYARAVREADAVVVGSYVPDGREVGDWVLDNARGVTAFYDIDTPITLAALERDACEYLRRDQVRRYSMYLSFTGGPTLARIERNLAAQSARPLYCSVDPEMYRPSPDDAARWDLSYMGTYSVDRQPGLERLLLRPARVCASHRFAVAGAHYPTNMSWPDNVAYREHVPPSEHACFYGASRLTLNLTRGDMVAAGYSPSVRLFEAAACGVPVVSDQWPGLESFFEPGREILLADSPEEIEGLLARDARARLVEVGRRARARALAEHTAAHRAATLEQYILELSGS